MKPTSFIVNITSEEPDRMKTFYRDVLELPPNPDIGDGAFDLLPGLTLTIDGHSETKGKAKEPQRLLIDFFVDDVAAEQTKLKSKGVRFIREEGKEYWGGVISTFLDPDGNYCQLVQYKPG